VCLGVLEQCVRDRRIGKDEEVVVFNTGAAQKYVEVMEVDLPRLRRESVDWELVADGR
jgi:threonine synthase